MLDLIQAYENYLSKVKQASENTIASYMRDVRQFAQWLLAEEQIDVIDAKQQNIADYLSHLEEEGRTGATVSRSLARSTMRLDFSMSSGFSSASPKPWPRSPHRAEIVRP